MDGTTQLEIIPEDLIYLVRGHNVRDDTPIENLFDLAESIKNQGIVQPVIVLKNEKTGHYELIAGERRLLAARLAEVANIPAVVHYEMSPIEKTMIMMVENFHREDLGPVGQARGFERLVDEGVSVDQISHRTGLKADYVNSRLRLLKLPDEVLEMLERPANALPIKQALMINRIKDPTRQIEAAGRIAPGDGPVMCEESARNLITSMTDKQMALDLDDDPDDHDGPQDPGQEPTPPPASATVDPTPPPDAPRDTKPKTGPIKPNTGTNKAADMIGIKGELPAVVTIEGTLITKKTGVKIQDAKITLEGGAVVQVIQMDTLCFDLGSSDIAAFCDFSAAALDLPEGGSDARNENGS